MRANLVLPVVIGLAGLLGHEPASAQALLRGRAAAPTLLRAKPGRTLPAEVHSGDKLGLKLAHGTRVRLRGGRLVAPWPLRELEEIGSLLDSLGVRPRRLFTQDEERLDELRARGELRVGRPLHDLNLFYLVESPGTLDVGAVCDRLNAFDLVEIAYPIGRVEDPGGVGIVSAGGDCYPEAGGFAPGPSDSTTPSFRDLQGYRGPAPLGIDAEYGQSFSGGRGIGTTIADVETGWVDDHEDLIQKAEERFVGLQPAPYPWDHGTAVLGELVGGDNGWGVEGLCADADVLMSSHLGFFENIPPAIMNAIDAVGPGDFVVLEVQCFDAPSGPHPCEYEPGTFAAIETATANGIHVTAAAGNGNLDLDDPMFGGAFDRMVRDSGAILCGASDGSSLDKASFSNHGSRLDAHGWGRNVVTTGYGSLFSAGNPPELRFYASAFSGTSSATPIVTGAAVILNAVHREAFGADMDPLVLRDLITGTGTPQGLGGNIGPRPDVRAALDSLGVPTIEVGGTLTPGGAITITTRGAPGDTYELFLAVSRRPVPRHDPPYGYLFLGDPVVRVGQGTLGLLGEAVDVVPIPPGVDPHCIFAFAQARVVFGNRPGTGTYTNVRGFQIQ